MTFNIDNSESNSGGKLGYYSPDHVNVRAGWKLGMRVRLKVVYGVITRYKFLGRISSIEPVAGMRNSKTVDVAAVDYMDELANYKLQRIPVQGSKTADQLLATVVANMPNAPMATDYTTGPDVYTRGLSSEQDEKTTALAACQKIALSGLDKVYLTGDATAGETLVYRSRHDRIKLTTVTAQFSANIFNLRCKRQREMIYNNVKVVTYPVKKDGTAVTLFTLQHELSLAPGQSYTLIARYTDPLGAGRRISGEEMVTPMVNTDYKMSSLPGGGNDLNTSLGVVMTFGANSAKAELTNNASITGYINLFNLRGKGLYEYDPIETTKVDAPSQALHGDRPLEYNLYYQDNPNVGVDFRDYLLGTYKKTHSETALEFIANADDVSMLAFLDCDVGTRVGVAESVTGISGQYFVNGYEFVIDIGGIVHCMLDPLDKADIGQFWLLENVGMGELDTTTTLGF
jgi:hypothetical protein